MSQQQNRLQRPCRMHRCERVRISDFMFDFWSGNKHFRGMVETCDARYYTVEVIGRLTDPAEFADQIIIMDVVQNSTDGFFTFLSGGDIPSGFVCALVCFTQRKIRAIAGIITQSDQQLDLQTSKGALCVKRTRDWRWGPHVYHGTVRHVGPIKVFV